METIVIVVHLLVALAIIGLILMQQGKGAEAGASFGGGASQTVFGSQGGSNFFAKATAVLAFIFFASSFSLAIIAKNKASVSVDLDIPSVTTEQIIQESEIPAAQEAGVGATDSELPAASPVAELESSATEEIPVAAPVESSIPEQAPAGSTNQ